MTKTNALVSCGPDKNQIIEELQPLFERAQRLNLWFYSSYLDVWFSPAELMAEQQAGRFVWGSLNWELRDPCKELARLTMASQAALEAAQAFAARMKNWNEGN